RTRRTFLHRQRAEMRRGLQEQALRFRRRPRWHREWRQSRKANTKAKRPSNFRPAQPRARQALERLQPPALDCLSGANTKANLVSRPSLVRAWRRWSLLELEYPHTLRNMESRVRANVPKNSVQHRRRLARPLVPKVWLRRKESEKALSARMLDQLRVALSAPAKISISLGASISKSSNRNLECHRLVQRLLVKVSINQAASIINASSSRQKRHPVKKVALLEPRAVLTVRVAANTK